MRKDKHGNECSKHLPVSVYTLAITRFDYIKAQTFAEKLYGKNGILFDVTGSSLWLNKADQVKLAIIDGACKWDQLCAPL